MASNNGGTSNTQRANTSDVTEVLIQHWAEMVHQTQARLDGLRNNYAAALIQIEQLDNRNDALYHDNLDMHRTLNEFVVSDHEKDALILRLTDLIITMIRENPHLRDEPRYRDEYFAAIAGFTPDQPIDLTADEEIDENL
jgi:hypothetical protein